MEPHQRQIEPHPNNIQDSSGAIHQSYIETGDVRLVECE